MGSLKKVNSVFVLCCLMGCSAHGAGWATTSLLGADINELEKDRVPGTVDDVWVEPMVDTVRIPGQLDPRGVYYRLPHRGVVEIRPGRFQKVEFPEDRVEETAIDNAESEGERY